MVLQPGYNFLGTLDSVNSVTLANLNLFTTNNATGVVGGLNSSVSDNLILVGPTGSVTTYFFYNNPIVFQGWVTAAGLNISDTVPIPAGSVFILLRQAGYSSFPWFIPAQ